MRSITCQSPCCLLTVAHPSLAGLCFVLSLTRSYSLGPCCQLQRPISRLGCPRNLACKNGKSGAASTVCVSFLPSSIGENAVKWKRRPEKRASRISWRTSASGVPLQSGKRPCASNRRLIVSSPSSFPISPLAFAYGLRKCIWALWLLCHRQQWTSWTRSTSPLRSRTRERSRTLALAIAHTFNFASPEEFF